MFGDLLRKRDFGFLKCTGKTSRHEKDRHENLNKISTDAFAALSLVGSSTDGNTQGSGSRAFTSIFTLDLHFEHLALSPFLCSQDCNGNSGRGK